MSEENQKQHAARRKYRLVIMNDETFEEVGSYRLSLFNVYTAVSTVLLFVVILVGSLFFFTPIKRLIPGYGEDTREQIIDLSLRADSLENALADWQFYGENIRKVLTGNLDTSRYNQTKNFMSDTIRNIDPIQEDLELRDKVAQEDWTVIRPSKKINPSELPLELRYMVSPVVEGYVTDHFKRAENHLGIDIAAPKNSPIRCILDGQVIFADWTLDTGYSVAVQHGNNLISFYKHNSVILKKVNSFVKAGEAIAIIGNTGDLSDGPHLHFELWRDGEAVNPIEYIRF